MRGANEHLSSQEIEELTNLDDASPEGPSDDAARQDAMRHLEACAVCRSRMLGLEPGVIIPPETGPRTPECPPEQKWLELAAGLLPSAESDRLLGHAETCGHCGRLLKIAIEDLALDLTPEEEAELNRLESAKPEWRAELVRKIGEAAGQQSMEGDATQAPFSIRPGVAQPKGATKAGCSAMGVGSRGRRAGGGELVGVEQAP